MNPISKMWLNRRHREVVKRVSFHGLCLCNCSRCVDVGCGMYPICEEVVKIDVEKLPNVDYVVDINRDKLPFQDASLEQIFCLEVIEHLENPQFFLNEVYRVLKPYGILVLTTPNEKHLLWRLIWAVWNRSFGEEWHHQNKFNLEMLKQFRIVNYGRINLFLQYIEVRK